LKIFNKNKLEIFWSFSQSGNIWRFIFGGNKYIVGETRDKVNKKLYFFTLDYNTGKIFLKNYSFENDNFWVSIEGANENVFFLGRFEKPELPYQKNIIAINIETGEKIWENNEYSYLLNTENQIYGIKRKFESNEIAELDIKTGDKIRSLSESEHIEILDLRNKNEDYIYENSNYPIVYNRSEAEESISKVIENVCAKEGEVQNIEYIQKGSLLIFNYYVKFTTDSKNTDKLNYENKFVVYDIEKECILFEDILNKRTNYCVPDNFFIKNNFLFYLKEKNLLNCIKLN
jgi:hypothetical protein